MTGQHIEPDHAVLACRITDEDQWCRRCGCQGISHDTVVRRLAHKPCGWRPTISHVNVRRYRCSECAHVWRHTPHGDRYVTVILDLTPVHDRSGPSRLLDMAPGRSKRVFKTWLTSQPDTWREGGHGSLPRRAPWPGMLSMSAAGAPGNNFTIGAGVPSSLTEIITLGRTLKRRSRDILTYLDHPHTSNDPTEAINGRLEHLRGSALGFAKPHQLHHPSTPRNRRIQTPTTPPIMKSRFAEAGTRGELA